MFPLKSNLSELTKVAESRAHFENMSQSMDDALVKNASISRQKPADATEGRNALTAVSFLNFQRKIFEILDKKPKKNSSKFLKKISF